MTPEQLQKLREILAELSPDELLEVAEAAIDEGEATGAIPPPPPAAPVAPAPAAPPAVPVPVPLAASAELPPHAFVTPVPTKVATKRPTASTVTKPTSAPAQLLTASGAPLPIEDLDEQLCAVLNGGKPGKTLVASWRRTEAAPELGDSAWDNTRTIETAMRALVASGGVCAPPTVNYSMQTVAVSSAPVIDSLPRFVATRGAVTFLSPPAFGDTTTGGVSVWTMDNDENPTNPTTKPFFTTPCNLDETTVEIEAIILSQKYGNFKGKYFPEQVNAWRQILEAKHSALREERILASMSSGSVHVTHGQILGTMRDLLATLDAAASHYRSRNRMSARSPITVVMPAWLLDMARVDVIRVGDRFEHYSWSDVQFREALSARGIAGVMSLDYQRRDGVQGPGPLIGWPSTVKVLMYAPGEWAYLDGGTWDLGVIRDSTLTATNDALAFMEVMQNVARTGAAGSYEITIDVCSSGLTVAGGDIDVCTSGS